SSSRIWMDDGQEGPEDGLGSGAGLPKGGRFGLGDDLLDGAKVEVVRGGSLPQAQLAREDTATSFRPELHVGEHSCLPLSGPKAGPSVTDWRSGALHFLVGKYTRGGRMSAWWPAGWVPRPLGPT